jgi:hypothetical protein
LKTHNTHRGDEFMSETTLPENIQQLTEHIDDWRTPDVLVDRDQRLVRNVALTGQQSRNGYRYSEAALRDAAGLYEHKPVFLDHAANVARPYERSTRDLAGSIVGPRFEDGRIRGDIQLFDTEAGRTLLVLAEANGPAVGMSHVVLASRSADKAVVEKIHAVVSVDAVVFPATTSTFGEQTVQELSPADDAAESIAELRQQLDDVLCERDRLRNELELLRCERQAAHQCGEVERLLQDAGLPEWAVTDVLRRQLASASSPEERRALIAERRQLIGRLRVYPPASGERVDDGASRTSDAAIIAALKRRRTRFPAGRG